MFTAIRRASSLVRTGAGPPMGPTTKLFRLLQRCYSVYGAFLPKMHGVLYSPNE
jgi:hypothetical protein